MTETPDGLQHRSESAVVIPTQVDTLIEVVDLIRGPQGPVGPPSPGEEWVDLTERVVELESEVDALKALVLGTSDRIIYGYEDPGKKNGDPLLAGTYGVVAKTGGPIYSSVAGLHASSEGQPALGIDGAANGSTVTYLVTNPSGETGQIYIMVGNRPANPAPIFDLRSATAFMVRIYMLASGKLSFHDAADTEQHRASYQCNPNEWFRLDWMIRLGAFGPEIEFRQFTDVNLETISASDAWTTPLLDTPYQYRFGNSGGSTGNGVRMYWDSFSLRGDAVAFLNPIAQAEDIASFSYGQIMPGNTPSEVAVAFLYAPTDTGKTMAAAWSTDPLMTSPSFTAGVVVDSLGIAKHLIAGLTPSTYYYVQPCTAGTHKRFGEVCRVKTLPPSTGPFSLKLHLGSCMQNSTDYNEAAYADIGAWAPDYHALLGDDGYWGGELSGTDPPSRDIGKYRNMYGKYPIRRSVDQSGMVLARGISDHELCDNGDTNNQSNPIDTGPTRSLNMPQSIRQLVAWQALLPVVRWGDDRDPRRHRGYSYDIGSKLRVIVLDFRTPDRSNVMDADSPTKTMFGAEQLDWFFATLHPHKLNLLFFETSWTADQVFVKNDAGDKPWHYPTEQNKICHRIDGSDGYQAGGYKVAMFGGDWHLVGYCSAADNWLGHFPVYIGSGWEKNGLDLVPGAAYTWQFGAQPPARTVMGYMQIILSYDGANTFTINATARVADTLSANPTTFFTPTSPVPMTVTDTFVVT